jgi:hypothetical protein
VPADAPSITYKIIKKLPRYSQLSCLIDSKAEIVIAGYAPHPITSIIAHDVHPRPNHHAMALALSA